MRLGFSSAVSFRLCILIYWLYVDFLAVESVCGFWSSFQIILISSIRNFLYKKIVDEYNKVAIQYIFSEKNVAKASQRNTRINVFN